MLSLALGKNSNFAECQSLGTRQSRRQMLTSVIFLPSADLALGKDFAECRFLTLGKEIFADKIFAERLLPSTALGKAFAECLAGFAECPQHSTKRTSAVVKVSVIKIFFFVATQEHDLFITAGVLDSSFDKTE